MVVRRYEFNFSEAGAMDAALQPEACGYAVLACFRHSSKPHSRLEADPRLGRIDYDGAALPDKFHKLPIQLPYPEAFAGKELGYSKPAAGVPEVACHKFLLALGACPKGLFRIHSCFLGTPFLMYRKHKTTFVGRQFI